MLNDQQKNALTAAREAGITTVPDKSAKKFPLLSVESLRKVRAGMQADIQAAQGLLSTLDAGIQKIKDDSTRNVDYQNAKVRELRNAALPAIGERVRTFDDRLEHVVGSQKYWQSKTLVLSMQAFDTDPVSNSTIRLRHVMEFAVMPAAVLQLIADDAIASANWPVLWQAYLAAQQRAGEPGWSGISLDEVEIDDRTEALKIIETCKTLAWTAHNVYGTASGNVMTGIDKLAAARAQQMLKAS